jgi:chromosome segregation protein
MITAKPEERRALFEEAAGVMKYRSRRRESELKMNSTRQNLERITDLLEEVRSQCRSLRQQASRAERFKSLQDECEQLQAHSFGIRYRQLGQQMDTIRLTLAEKQKQEAEKAKHHTESEAELAKAREALIAHETEAQIKQESLRSAEQQRATLQQQAERMAGERRLLAERKSGLQQRIEEMQQRTKVLTEEIERLKQQMESSDDSRLQKVRQETAEKVTAAEEHFAKAREMRDHLLAEFERLRSEFENQEKRRQQAQSALERLEQRHQIVQGQFEETRNQLQTGETAMMAARDSTANAEKRVAETAGALEDAQAELDRCRKERENATAQRAESEKKVRALRGESQELTAQLAHQDVPERLREQMRSRGAIWIDESLQVPEGLEQAVAAALRGKAADVSLPANPSLSEWQELCVEAKDLPIAMFATGLAEQESLDENLALSIGLTAKHPLFNVFSHIRLCENIFNRKPSRGHSLVSRDGWRLEPDGWLIPPAQSHTARRLILQRRQRECEAELKKAEQLLQTGEDSVQKSEDALTLQQQNWQQAHLAATESESSLQSTQATLKRLEDGLAALNERTAHLTRENDEIGKDIQHWQEQRDGVSGTDQKLQLDAKEKLDTQAAEQQHCEHLLHQVRSELASADQALALHQQAIENLQREELRIAKEIEQLNERINQDRGQLARTDEELTTAAAHEGLDRELRTASEAVEAAHQALNSIRQKGHELQQQSHACERVERETRTGSQQSNEVRQKIEIQLATEQARIQDLEEDIRQRFKKAARELAGSLDELPDVEDAEQIVQRARELEERLSRFGPVNLLAIDEFQQASEREAFLSEQSDDLEASLKTLTDTISRIDRTMRQRFIDVFEETNRIFKETFPRLFGGGRAELRLDSEDVLTAGVSVIAQPPGKHLGDVSLLSGGEKALTAVALVFSIFQIKPAPFCILDEVDAPLDDANVGRYNDMLKELADRVQFLAISHNKITMQRADRLIGVSMPEAGVSRIVAVDMEKVA